MTLLYILLVLFGLSYALRMDPQLSKQTQIYHKDKVQPKTQQNQQVLLLQGSALTGLYFSEKGERIRINSVDKTTNCYKGLYRGAIVDPPIDKQLPFTGTYNISQQEKISVSFWLTHQSSHSVLSWKGTYVQKFDENRGVNRQFLHLDYKVLPIKEAQSQENQGIQSLKSYIQGNSTFQKTYL